MIIPDILPVDSIAHRAAVAIFMGAHLKSFDISVFPSTISALAVKAPEIVGPFHFIENFIPMISARYSRKIHHLLIKLSMAFFSVFHLSSKSDLANN
ncbi:MAG: hypothetical protein A2W25_02260 [candidate division Zixibacteria bacterium RBG_16_53_22]|nr:MAG: hypothetical protein A2W25_02260 [candidate division Zixibacteria bacterium RBG_16_53_22]